MRIRALLACALATAIAATTAPTDVCADTIPVDGGMIDGKTLPAGVQAWFGVPFAAPPVRDLRWRPPAPVQPWEGTFHADRFAPMCLQPLRSRTMNHYFGNEATSEDCLYLNIWAPPHGEKRPVVVWIYGGAFNVGSASMANYGGEHLAAKGVVYVSLAYRVGPMGFFAHPDLTAEGGGHSGNYGLMDQVAGLEWVRRNIARFGGDPDNVTIMGQSAGSMSVSLLQMDPTAKGLFRRIVGMSGSSHGGMMAPVSLERAEADGVKLQKALSAGGIEAMRDLPGDRILQVAATIPRSAITIDGTHITGTAQQVFAAHRQNDVPVMVGFVRDERFADLGRADTVAQYQQIIRATFPRTAEQVLKAYPAANDADVHRAMVDVMRDMSVGRQMFDWASDNVTYGRSPAYGFFFTRRHPYTAGISFADHDPATVGVYHTGDVPYWLDTLDALNMYRKTRDWTAMDRHLAQTMSDMIVSFATTGKPSADWPVFSVKAPRSMMLGEEVRTIDWPDWKALPLLADPAPSVPKSAPAPSRPRD